MNFSEKVAEINGKVKSYKLEIEGVEKIPAEDMVRVMLEEGQMLEPCRIIGESDDYIDFMVVDLENGPVFSISINKEKIIADSFAVCSVLNSPIVALSRYCPSIRFWG